MGGRVRAKRHKVDEALDVVELAELARSVGCIVLEQSSVDMLGATWNVLDLDCIDNETACAFLTVAADHDSADPRIRERAAEIRRDNPGEAYAAGVQAYVRELVTYVPEAHEEFQTAELTLEEGQGDCDKQSRAVAALCIAGGLKARCTPVKLRGEIVHVCAQVADPKTGEWIWLETTLDAKYGEEPIAAGIRLGVIRGAA